MSKMLLTLISVLSVISLFGQTEFKTHKNGLIYSESTMSKLAHIADSLNLKYKACDLNQVFYSQNQTIAYSIRLDSSNIKQAKADMENGISFDLFVDKYPRAKIKKDILIVKFKYKDYDNNELVNYSEVNFNDNYGMEITKENKQSQYDKEIKGSWIYDYFKKPVYSQESIIGFYFPENFKSMPIDLKYSRLIAYSDCLIDTSSPKFYEDATYGSFDFPRNWESFSAKRKGRLLQRMRHTKVVGSCSQDASPRIHAINIALVSAETTNWEVFLKAHLDIMNDKFDRMSDGNYAYAQRKTYIKELEELNINVIDLLLGISLRIENPANNHYYGNIGRLGRAISESKYKVEFENQILAMMENDELDDYNRIMAYFLFISYNSFNEDEVAKKEQIDKLKLAIAKMPDYLKIKVKE